jgi:hypothetical protein
MPTALHPQHTLWLSDFSDNCPSSSIPTVLLSTIPLAPVSDSMDVTTVTSISPGPSLGKVGSDSDKCSPSLGLSCFGWFDYWFFHGFLVEFVELVYFVRSRLIWRFACPGCRCRQSHLTTVPLTCLCRWPSPSPIVFAHLCCRVPVAHAGL